MEERMALNRQKTKLTADTKEQPGGELGSVVPAAAATAKDGAPGAGSPAQQAPAAQPAAESTAPKEIVWPRDYSFFIFGPDNPIREKCIEIVSSPYFDNGILALIVVSTLAMLVDNPRW